MRLPVHIWIREANSSTGEIVGYFTELARRLDERPQKMRLIIESTVPVTLDFEPLDGNPTVKAGGKAQKFSLRRRWIPEHPVPLELGPMPDRRIKRTLLLIDPVDGNRFRVYGRKMFSVPDWGYVLVALTGVVAVVTLHPVAVCFAVFLFLALFVSLRLHR